MKSSVVHYILLLLDTQESVRIPGVGTLTKRITPARLDTDQRQVHPPTPQIAFKASSKKTGKMLGSYIAYRTGLDEELATAHVDSFADRITNRLNENGRVVVKHLGVFYKEGNKVQFAADATISNLGFKGLHVVPLPQAPPVRKPAAAEPVSQTQPETKVEKAAVAAVATAPVAHPPEGMEAAEPSTPREWKVPVVFPIFLFAFILVSVIAVMNYMSRGDQYPASAYNRTPTETLPVSPTSDDSIEEAGLNEEFEVKEEATEPEDEGAATIQADKEEAESDVNPVESNNPQDEGLVDLDDNEPAVDPAAERAQTIPTPPKNEEVTDDSQWPGMGSSQCFVIVGAFGVASNVDRMLTRLQGMGYEVATMPNRGLTQVGVPMPCEGSEIEAALGDLQTHVEAQAWIFKR